MRRIAAVAIDAEKTRRGAKLLVAALAYRTSATTDPGIDQPLVTNLDAARLGADRDHLADILVAHGERQLHAAILQTEYLSAAEIVKTFPDMQVAMTDAGRQHLEQHLAAGRFGVDPLGELHWLAATADLETAHRTPSRLFIFAVAGHFPDMAREPYPVPRVTANSDDLFRGRNMPENWSPPPPLPALTNIFARSG